MNIQVLLSSISPTSLPKVLSRLLPAFQCTVFVLLPVSLFLQIFRLNTKKNFLTDPTTKNTYLRLLEIKPQCRGRIFPSPHKGLDSLCPMLYSLSINTFYNEVFQSLEGPLSFLLNPGVSWQYLLSHSSFPRTNWRALACFFCLEHNLPPCTLFSHWESISHLARINLPFLSHQPCQITTGSSSHNQSLGLRSPSRAGLAPAQHHEQQHAVRQTGTLFQVSASSSLSWYSLLSSSRQRAKCSPKTCANILPVHIKTESLSYPH